ncbi:hypothetical protein ACGFT2_12565 [Streptomyces sp. NPDC048514]|uniref:hypothetical protein n=1 Tax=Streptomyces sp. NPDC048514 TaxID=3365564 RepID=UPI003723D461
MEQRIGSNSKPSEGEPTEAGPANAESAEPGSARAEPVKAEPAKAGSVKAEPVPAGAEAGSVKTGSVKAEPVTGAGFDPAFIPGITAPVAAAAVPAQAEPQDAVREAAPDADADTATEPADAGAPEDAEPAEREGPAADEEAAGGPVFEAADRRARIVADRKGVRLSLDEESCEFRWDEIAAVETESPRFGKRFTITVYTPERRWYPIEIEAPARARFADWESELDAVLDAYFEDGDAA